MATRKTAAPKTAPKSAVKPAPDAKARVRLAAKVVKLRDDQGKSWKDIEQATGQNPGQLRRLYNAGRKSATEAK
jgi:cyanate lyase